MALITKTNTIINDVLTNCTAYNSSTVEDFEKSLLLTVNKRRVTLSSSITCRNDEESDYENTYLGTVHISLNKATTAARVKYKVYLVEHYFFSAKLIFIKVGKGKIGHTPGNDYLDYTVFINN